MKSEEEVGIQTANPKRSETNLKELSINILKTVLLLGKSYGPNYIANLLRGDFYFKNQEHSLLETHGSTPYHSNTELRLVIQQLVGFEYLEFESDAYISLEITDKGKNYLDEPIDLIVKSNLIVFNSREIYMNLKLKEFRLSQCKRDNLRPYHVFTDYTMDWICREEPQTMKELSLIPGMSEERIAKYGGPLLGLIEELQKKWGEILHSKTRRLVQHFTHQEVKRLFQEGKLSPEIAVTLGIREETVYRYLGHFHEIGELDLRPWIEEVVDSKELHKGVEYFRKLPGSNLREAHKSLELDYETLKLCKLYIMEPFLPRGYAHSA